MIRRPPRSTQSRSSAASDVYKRQLEEHTDDKLEILMLMMRRHEKDFIMRADPKYVDRIDARDTEFRTRLASIRFGDDVKSCLLYTSDAADDLLCVDLGGRRIIKKKKK
eukprot:TRINITY_DN3022_c0_g1_i1.p1 TRINITY_DN3022_c0_g1~~TRINITY_DN3022_c0_g1_i1.p1  ORF type:complete len:109 (+),score=66.68 TRINITY_DN3022_c0_g1_i1:112-438(+)